MSPLNLTLKDALRQRVDASPLTPDRLAGRSPAQIAATELVAGNRRVCVGDLFDVSGDDPADLRLEGPCGKLDRIGAAMAAGRITVAGDAGDYLGLAMAGGRIEVHGNCGSHAACEMRQGFIHVHGSVGDFLGAALPGEPRGMRGGTVIVGGDAGERAGDRMRRGMLLIEGDAGDYCASRMGAGTIAVLGRLGANPGFAMSRGTVLTGGLRAGLLPTFNDCGVCELGFVELLARSWRGLPGRFGQLSGATSQVHRYMGDLANGGKGEILVR
jgi:formylmethanofuran dehydrogenase subunit C